MAWSTSGGAYFDPEFDSLFERSSPQVCIDNESCKDCTLVKVDSANRHGILLDMVQVLTDLDLVISKSYISSDGGWLMDVFHVTDQLGGKVTNGTIIRFIQQSMASDMKKQNGFGNVKTCLGKLVGPGHLASDHTAIELTVTDRPGMLSEVSAVLAGLRCQIVTCQAWTHNSRAAAILYIADQLTSEPISDLDRLAHIQQQVDSVVLAHRGMGEKGHVSVSGPVPGRIHIERRLHQLMHDNDDYNAGDLAPWPANGPPFGYASSNHAISSAAIKTMVHIDSWEEKGYSVVNIRSRDRPKLFFDTVCTLTDLQYAVFHAAVSSQGAVAVQEYYIRHKNGCTSQTEAERQRVTRSLVAAVERRVSYGWRLNLCVKNGVGLLSHVTRVIREHGLSLTLADCSIRGEIAYGTFYVRDASNNAVDPKTLQAVRKEIGDSMNLKMSDNNNIGWSFESSAPAAASGHSGRNLVEEDRPRFSFGSLLWSQLGWFSSIRS